MPDYVLNKKLELDADIVGSGRHSPLCKDQENSRIIQAYLEAERFLSGVACQIET